MKIMLEHGGDFGAPENQNAELSPEMENAFLNNIIEFEKQFQQRKTTTVYKKIGEPKHFKPVSEIPDAEIEDEWNKLSDYMQLYGVDLSVSSPKVTARELYRFTTEELFKHEIDDVNIPGIMSGFIYDEFYPDYEYGNTRYAIDDCIKLILSKEPLDFLMWFAKENIQLNNHYNLTEEKLKEIVNSFKNKFDDIELKEIENVSCDLKQDNCKIIGTHETILTFDNTPVTVKSNWLVEFILHNDYWSIVNVQIKGVEM
jgi:hypothetical protein